MQGIEFQIVNDSNEAAQGIDRLAASLANLKTGLGNGGGSLKTVAKNITAIKTSLDGLNTGKLAGLATALESLRAKTDGLKISTSIGNQLQSIGTAVNAIPTTVYDRLTALANGLRPLSELGRSNLTSFINQLSRLPEVIAQLEAADIGRFSQQMQSLATAMAPFASQMQSVANGFSAFPSRIQRLVRSTEQYNGTVQRATKHTNSWGSALRKISAVAVFRVTSRLLAGVIGKSSEYTEMLNMFTTSVGGYAEEAYNYAQKVSEVLGIDPATWMENQGVFQSIITGFGVAGDKAAIMSKNLTQLAYDLSSFYNIGVTGAMQKVQSGISGELEPLRRLGYDLSVARLQQEAYNLGIKKSVSEMTQAEKAQLRYHAMLTQVTQVQGDMARTLEQPANQLRVLKAQVEQAARAFGNLFIPILNKVLPIAVAVASAIREIVNAIGALFGVQMSDGVDWDSGASAAAGATDDIASNMDDAAGSAKKMKSYLMGIDELNVLPSQNDGGSGAGAGGGAGFELEPIDYDFLGDAVTKRIDEIKAKIQPVVDWIIGALGRIKARLDKTFSKIDTEKLLASLKPLKDGLLNFLGAVGDFAAMLYDEVLEPALLFVTNELAPALFESVGDILYGIGDAIEYLTPVVRELIDMVEPVAFAVLDFIRDIVGALGNLGDIVAGIAEFISGVVFGNIDEMKEGITRFLTGGQNLVAETLDAVRNLGLDISYWFIDLIEGLVGKDVADQLRAFQIHIDNAFQFVKETVYSVFYAAKEILTGLVDFVGGAFTGDWKKAWEGLKTIVKGVFQGIAAIFASMINVIIRGLNRIKVNIPSWVPGIGGKTFGINIPQIEIPKLANGGFVDSGQLFIAREAGAEMVGSIGRRTAVANNDQIVEGITAGVSNANADVVNAIFAVATQLVAAINEKDNNVYLDGARVAARVTANQSQQSRMYGR